MIAIALMALVAIPAVTMAAPRGHGHGHGKPGPGEMMRMLADRLDMSEEQRTQLEGLHQQHREAMQAQREQLREAQRQLADQMHAETFDEGAIRNAAATVAALKADLAVAKAALHREVRALLTPEQLEQFREIQERRRERTEEGKGFRGRGGHGPGDCWHSD
jgi:Spy/CpxP family protein refolding chaperone